MKAIAAVTSVLVFLSAASGSFAAGKVDPQVGWAACENWCLNHNATFASRIQCINNCAIYWGGKKAAGGLSEAYPVDPPPRKPIVAGGLVPINSGLGEAQTPPPGGQGNSGNNGGGGGGVIVAHPTAPRPTSNAPQNSSRSSGSGTLF